MNLKELLEHIVGKRYLKIYVYNITENEDYYELDELFNYGHYIVTK